MLRDGLAAEYCFAGNAEDTSGCGRHGVAHGATLTSDRFGRPDHAYHFDGIDDYIEVTPPPIFSSDAMSVSAWVRYEPREFRGWTNCIVAQDDGNDEDQSRRVFQLSTDSGHIVWHRMIGSRDPMCRRRVRPGVWCHAVAVHDHGMNRLWVDGVLHDTVEHRLWIHNSQPMHIGRKGTPEPHFFFQGAIDDVRIYGRTLGDDEILELLHEGGWEAPSPKSRPVEGDPLSGRWGRDGVVFLDLRYDGHSQVTGQIMGGRPSNMAPITVGTFNRNTAELRLEGSARDAAHEKCRRVQDRGDAGRGRDYGCRNVRRLFRQLHAHTPWNRLATHAALRSIAVGGVGVPAAQMVWRVVGPPRSEGRSDEIWQ